MPLQRLEEGLNAVAPYIMEVDQNAQQSAVAIRKTIVFPNNRRAASLVDERPPLFRCMFIVILCCGIPALFVAILQEFAAKLCQTVEVLYSNLCKGIQQQQRGLVVNQKLLVSF
jgi:hypothetical protein